MTATADGTHRLTEAEISAVAEAVVAGTHGEPGRLSPAHQPNPNAKE